MLLRILALTVLVLITGVSCARESAVLQLSHYREPHQECAGLDLSRREFNSDTLKRAIGCFNAGGKLQDLADFTTSLDEPEMVVTLELVHKFISANAVLSPSQFIDGLGDSMEIANSTLKLQDVRAGLDFFRSERTSLDQSLFLLPFGWAKKFKVSVGESELIDLKTRLAAAIDRGVLDRLLELAPLFFTREQVFKPLFDLSALMLQEPVVDESRRLLSRGARFLRRQDFPEIIRFIETLVRSQASSEEPAPREREIALDWIMAKVRDKACVADIARQRNEAIQIVNDYENSITSWELKDGRGRRSWEYTELKNKLTPLVDKLSDLSQSSRDNPLWRSMVDVVGAFAADYLVSWLRDRSDDYQLIQYFYPGEETPRLRLVNSLDRMELILINSDFSYDFLGLFPMGNKGYEFMAELATAWGDESPESWPEEIKKQFPNPSPGRSWPKTLREAYDKIAKELAKYEKLAGRPSIPKCDNAANITAADSDISTSALNLIPFYIKARLFNIRQIISVVSDNLPGSETVFDGGLKVLRNFLFATYVATPAQDRDPNAGWRNHFSALTRMAELGFLRQTGRAVWKLSDQEAKDVFVAATEAVRSTSFHSLTEMILIDDPEQRLLWAAFDEVFAGGLNELAFFAAAAAGASGLVAPVLETSLYLLRQNKDYFLDRMGWIATLLRSPPITSWARVIYQSERSSEKVATENLLREWLGEREFAEDGLKIIRLVASNSEIVDAWQLFQNRMTVAINSPDFIASVYGEILIDLLHFFEESSGEAQADTAIRVREFMADRMDIKAPAQMSEVEEIWGLIAKDPSRFYSIIENLAHHLEKGEFKKLQDLAIKTLLGS